jgi:DNA-directed RNA polymerase subunit E'/Rpb7
MSNNNKETLFINSLEKTKKFEKTVEIHPIFLNDKILETVKEKLFSSYINSCTDEGIIVDIKDIIDISNIISKDCCFVIFKLKFTAIILKPETGYKIIFKPVKIISKGIFGKLYGESMNIFISAQENWKFIEQENCFSIKSNKNKIVKISMSTEITAKITALKFDFNNSLLRYNCICEIVI